MKKLLVPVDGSENAQRAVEYATSLAKLTGASLHLLHVCESFDDSDRSHAYFPTPELERPGRELGEGYVKAAQAQVAAEGLRVSSEVIPGDIAPTIVRRANELGCTGIVMGTRGLGALATIFIGSTAMEVVRQTSLPVTLVK